MPETINFEFALSVAMALFSVIGMLIWALSHMYYMLIQKSISSVDAKVEEIKDDIDGLHGRVTDHIESYHTLKP